MNSKMFHELTKYYSKTSKHSQYQAIPEQLQKILGNKLSINSRYEHERLDYILKNIDIVGKTILDIGGNTGFFTFGLIEKGAKCVDYYDGNEDHAKFVSLAATALKVKNKVIVNSDYFSFDNSYQKRHDVTLLLNVLHHVGSDYSRGIRSLNKAKKAMARHLNALSFATSTLVLQIGYNWQGDISKGLFRHGTKTEMIEFIEQETKNSWDVEKIGIAEQIGRRIEYKDANARNLVRDDRLGEFLNRPIFILKSRNYHEAS